MGDYRGKRVDNGEWLYGYYRKVYSGRSEIMPLPKHLSDHEWFTVDPETVGQSIGKLDKDKTKIYGGDELDGGFHAFRGGEVFWDENNCSFSERNFHATSLPLKDTSKRKITGNIHGGK